MHTYFILRGWIRCAFTVFCDCHILAQDTQRITRALVVAVATIFVRISDPDARLLNLATILASHFPKEEDKSALWPVYADVSFYKPVVAKKQPDTSKQAGVQQPVGKAVTQTRALEEPVTPASKPDGEAGMFYCGADC